MMPEVAIIYHSSTGTIEKLALEIANGVNATPGISVKLCRIRGEDIKMGRYMGMQCISTIDHCEGVIFGAPTYMAGPSAQFKAFADSTSSRWAEKAWKGKLATGFTSGNGDINDQMHTLQYFSFLASMHDMKWIDESKRETSDGLACPSDKYMNKHESVKNGGNGRTIMEIAFQLGVTFSNVLAANKAKPSL